MINNWKYLDSSNYQFYLSSWLTNPISKYKKYKIQNCLCWRGQVKNGLWMNIGVIDLSAALIFCDSKPCSQSNFTTILSQTNICDYLQLWIFKSSHHNFWNLISMKTFYNFSTHWTVKLGKRGCCLLQLTVTYKMSFSMWYCIHMTMIQLMSTLRNFFIISHPQWD